MRHDTYLDVVSDVWSEVEVRFWFDVVGAGEVEVEMPSAVVLL